MSTEQPVEAITALLQHNEVQIDIMPSGMIWVSVCPRHRAPLWYWETGATLAEALSKAAEHRLAKVGSPAPAGTKEGNKQ